MTLNPYEAPPADNDAVTAKERQAARSVKSRNVKSLAFCIGIYTVVCIAFTAMNIGSPEYGLKSLLVVAMTASGWANIPLGMQIGWSRGGMPVVFVATIVAATIYAGASLVIGNIVTQLIFPQFCVIPPAPG